MSKRNCRHSREPRVLSQPSASSEAKVFERGRLGQVAALVSSVKADHASRSRPSTS